MDIKTATPASTGPIGNAKANNNYECDRPVYVGNGNMTLGHQFHYETRNVSTDSLSVIHNTYYISLPPNSTDRSGQDIGCSGCQCRALMALVKTLAAIYFASRLLHKFHKIIASV
ncbi:hypothetical protein FLAG1_06194 [Fusarium langsethiae]|uniref:Uncharacterized protein n=1 Tax=Fusarium langsethiae TaxID=179993 RepID=A0A0M9EWH6_FUSLA|nr:hypothetical protein FLAG1_06194 [Fusarium langsethiae]